MNKIKQSDTCTIYNKTQIKVSVLLINHGNKHGLIYLVIESQIQLLQEVKEVERCLILYVKTPHVVIS